MSFSILNLSSKELYPHFRHLPIPRRTEAFQYWYVSQIAWRFAKVSSSVILKSVLAISHIGNFLISITFFIRLNKELFEANWRSLAQISISTYLIQKTVYTLYIFLHIPCCLRAIGDSINIKTGLFSIR